jgi:hypothetical protein
MPVRERLPACAAAVLLAGALLLPASAAAQESEPRNLSFEEALPAPGAAPPGWWFIQHAGPTSFEFAIDDKVAKDGKQSLRIQRTGTQPFGLVLQRVKPDRFRGKRARLSAFLRLENVEPYGRGALRDMSGAVLMLRSQGGSGMTLDDMRDRPLRGTKPWTEVSVEIDVPPSANVLEFAAMLSGTGTLWVDAVRLEVVDPSDASATPPK